MIPLLLAGCLTLAASPATPPDFDTQVVPLLTRAGCNSGACHGAAAGRGGFRLSLFGADPTADYDAIVHEFEGRRINLVKPSASLLYAKPTGNLDHGGSVVLLEDTALARHLLDWIAAGAPRGRPRKLLGIRVAPTDVYSRDLPASVPVSVIARFDDGAEVDVTGLALLISTDPGAVNLGDASGPSPTAVSQPLDAPPTIHVKRRGQHTVLARFLDHIATIRVTAPYAPLPLDLGQQPRANFIDEEILGSLESLRIPVSPMASDSEYVRRVALDLTGRLPTPELVEGFLADERLDKRQRLVDSLLSTPAFNDYWALQLARLLRLHSLPHEPQVARVYGDWLREQLRSDMSIVALAGQLLTATGDSHVVAPANFGRMVADARGQAELVGQAFLGIQIGCANCHNHPLDKWTQDDYHGLAAVFARLERGRQVRVLEHGAVTNPRTLEPARPRIPGQRDLSGEDDPRVALADWLTSDGQRLLARVTVNRLWRAMFGRGLVEPVDDLRETNPPTHPRLLDRLTADFIEHDASIRHTLRTIALSQAYGRGHQSVPGNEFDRSFYSKSLRRPLEPEVLVDAIDDVIGVPREYTNAPAGTRAVQLLDPLSPVPSLTILGRCSRADGCDQGGSSSGGALPAQLHLLNGDVINGRLHHELGYIQVRLSDGVTDEQLVRELYLRALSRQPSDAELGFWRKELIAPDPGERRRRFEDFAWGLLNSRDFRENH